MVGSEMEAPTPHLNPRSAPWWDWKWKTDDASICWTEIGGSESAARLAQSSEISIVWFNQGHLCPVETQEP